MILKRVVNIQNWFLHGDYNKTPCKVRLCGIVNDEARNMVDKLVTTSELVKLDLEKGLAETQNTLYTLGEPDKAFMKHLEEDGASLESYHL